MKAAVAISVITTIALGVILFCATMFDRTTLLFVVTTMLIVSFFSSAAVVLGVMTRRAANRCTDNADARVDDNVQIIRSDDDPPSVS